MRLTFAMQDVNHFHTENTRLQAFSNISSTYRNSEKEIWAFLKHLKRVCFAGLCDSFEVGYRHSVASVAGQRSAKASKINAVYVSNTGLVCDLS